MLALFFDTETTGLINQREPAISPVQPSLVQLGALLVDLEDRRELQSIDVIIQPDGWTIPTEASNVHGIPQALAEKVGILLEHAVLPFRDLVSVSQLIVAHNISYDKVIMERASAMVDVQFGVPVGALWTPVNELLCTKLMATPVVKKKSKRPSHAGEYAWPKLNEAYNYFYGKELEGAHNAMVDVKACKDIFFALADQGHLDDVLYTKVI